MTLLSHKQFLAVVYLKQQISQREISMDHVIVLIMVYFTCFYPISFCQFQFHFLCNSSSIRNRYIADKASIFFMSNIFRIDFCDSIGFRFFNCITFLSLLKISRTLNLCPSSSNATAPGLGAHFSGCQIFRDSNSTLGQKYGISSPKRQQFCLRIFFLSYDILQIGF